MVCYSNFSIFFNMRSVLAIFNSVHFNRELGRQFTPKFKFSGGGNWTVPVNRVNLVELFEELVEGFSTDRVSLCQHGNRRRLRWTSEPNQGQKVGSAQPIKRRRKTHLWIQRTGAQVQCQKSSVSPKWKQSFVFKCSNIMFIFLNGYKVTYFWSHHLCKNI